MILASVRRWSLLLPLGISSWLAACDKPAPPPPPKAPATVYAVEAVFKRFKSAIISNEGAEAVKHLDAGTIARLEAIRKLALDAGKEELKGVPIVDRAFAISLRLTLPFEDVVRGDAVQFAQYLVDKSMIYQMPFMTAQLIEVEFAQDKAKGLIMQFGTYNYAPVEFVDEGGVWKVSLEPVLARQTEFHTKLWDSQKVTEDEVIEKVARSLTITNREVPDPWQPMRERAAKADPKRVETK
jgi:hypothetical protein